MRAESRRNERQRRLVDIFASVHSLDHSNGYCRAMTESWLLIGSGIVLAIIFFTLSIRAYLRKVAKADEAREDDGHSKGELLLIVILALVSIVVLAAVIW